MTETVIDVIDLKKIYRTDQVETHALAGVDLAVKRGEYVAVTGPSGCGKSTLMAILGLLDDPSAGVYRLAGHDAAHLRERDRAIFRNRHIGFVFQAFNLIGDLSVAENVALPLIYRGGIAKAARDERVAAILSDIGMAHRAQHYPAQLSGGQQQRVAIARALVTEPDIILADEPTGNLDSKAGEAVMALLEDLNTNKGATILMVTHDLHYARRARRIVRLSDGQVVDESFGEAVVALHKEDDHLPGAA
ncbi:MAG: ABC transporter ATP-binding protein [Acidiphilium sp. 37-64-53]|uniref:ABC transporter ATP-binding protein n=1 Tax=Acidiphilium TaxID=522 RepID=UPI000BD76AAB|nr:MULTISPECIES: ABC transporter ATP-binding protein [Acidiphilium]OYW02937.1 MAG: ABC transporter ATP-binding protein [Acidiphilium sp. 37-64-53]OZB30509.1 MAG: ABC transporter ATP-binding protein [Acidiphilium sp. 34-64-41]HQT85205.1 ABC transporter ATP-binding protein [Acidiphilium rubrum]